MHEEELDLGILGILASAQLQIAPHLMIFSLPNQKKPEPFIKKKAIGD